ncbi:MAG: phosphoglucosamine mutase [Elusimicrobia bacterium HGW-Elusimicrobia-1]|jgi:phosphoglucosamine mutase|nr:MAG: phosphoglucosamine mutase [Elusimicrobia bacterium HGW-Elusimicrobia-1]
MKLFGTDGIRGEYGKGFFARDAFCVEHLAYCAGRVLKKHSASDCRAVIGRDTRESSEEIEKRLAEGFAAAGVLLLSAGVVPTPAVSYLARAKKFAAGVVVSASHNPWRDNGIKFFSPDGEKFSDALESEIEKEYFASAPRKRPPVKAGLYAADFSTAADYERYTAGLCDVRLDGLKIVVDCANGAASTSGPKILRAAGAEVVVINASPDGRNINENCGSLHPEGMSAEVVRVGADCGVSFDGDADRAIFSDEQGGIVDGDRTLAVCALHMKKSGLLPGGVVVATVMSNIGFLKAMKSSGVKVAECPVGDKSVREEMKKSRAVLGGEQSGHVIFGACAATGDGILTAIRLFGAMKSSGAKLSVMTDFVRIYPQTILNVEARDKKSLESLPLFVEALAEEEKKLGDSGRIFVRYSGTEPLLRIMVEGPDGDAIKSIAARLKKVYLESV